MNTAVVTVKNTKDSCAPDISRRGAQKRCYRSIIRTESARGAMQSRGGSLTSDTIRYKQTEKDSLTSKLGSAGVGGILAKP